MKVDITQLNEKDIGRWVWYTSFNKVEKGRIKSWNHNFIFVVYNCGGEWKRFKDFTAAATEPSDIEFIKHQNHCRAELGFVCSCLPPDIKLETSDLI